jgi:hypothetical protein
MQGTGAIKWQYIMTNGGGRQIVYETSAPMIYADHEANKICKMLNELDTEG